MEVSTVGVSACLAEDAVAVSAAEAVPVVLAGWTDAAGQELQA